ncbi:MAG: aspartate aminotransferase family protein [Pseudomonadales bacterium]|nr:aspartate aminotransferase family protein [Pseudomonadales bacterium]
MLDKNRLDQSIWPFVPAKRVMSIQRAKGNYLYTKSGKKILDAAGGCIVSNIGYGVEEVAEAVSQAIKNCTFVMPPWLTEEREVLINELREHWLPPHLSRIHLASGGSEANETAIKMAIQYHAGMGHQERTVILTRDISYHGTTISMAAISGHPDRKRGLEGILDVYPNILTPYPLRCPLGAFHENATEYYLKDLEDRINEIGPNKIAALIAEPLNGSSGGAITPPQDYWQGAQKILKKHGILLIMDEVMTGFGRTGYKFGSELYGIKPDILVAGKGLAGGYAAIAGVFGTEEIAEGISRGGFNVMFHTFAALPQSCAAATCVLQILRRDELVLRSKSIGAKLKKSLTEKFSQHPLVAEIRGEGMLIGVEIVSDRGTLEPFPKEARITEKVIGYGLKEGVFFYPGGTGDIRDIVCLGPAFTLKENEIDEIVNALSVSLDRVLEAQSD